MYPKQTAENQNRNLIANLAFMAIKIKFRTFP